MSGFLAAGRRWDLTLENLALEGQGHGPFSRGSLLFPPSFPEAALQGAQLVLAQSLVGAPRLGGGPRNSDANCPILLTERSASRMLYAATLQP